MHSRHAGPHTGARTLQIVAIKTLAYSSEEEKGDVSSQIDAVMSINGCHFVAFMPCRPPHWSAPPQQGGRPVKRRAGRSPSPSGSYSSYGSHSSYSSSGSEGSRRPPVNAGPPGVQGTAYLSTILLCSQVALEQQYILHSVHILTSSTCSA